VLPYLTIVLFAILEGEIYYSKVCADAMIFKLNWAGVWCAGALGGSIGDQFWFYLLRKRIHWLDRFPKLAKYRDAVSQRVHAHEALMVLSGRFLPGLRTAIPIACAYANVRPLKFSALNLVSGVAWAGVIMLFVKLGSSTLSAFGLDAWWGPLIPAAMVIVFFRWLSRPRKQPGPRTQL
jgi:membrane protein DedA with SNARE-associated domain